MLKHLLQVARILLFYVVLMSVTAFLLRLVDRSGESNSSLFLFAIVVVGYIATRVTFNRLFWREHPADGGIATMTKSEASRAGLYFLLDSTVLNFVTLALFFWLMWMWGLKDRSGGSAYFFLLFWIPGVIIANAAMSIVDLYLRSGLYIRWSRLLGEEKHFQPMVSIGAGGFGFLLFISNLVLSVAIIFVFFVALGSIPMKAFQ